MEIIMIVEKNFKNKINYNRNTVIFKYIKFIYSWVFYYLINKELFF